MKLLETYNISPIPNIIKVGYSYRYSWIWLYPDEYTKVCCSFRYYNKQYIQQLIDNGTYKRISK